MLNFQKKKRFSKSKVRVVDLKILGYLLTRDRRKKKNTEEIRIRGGNAKSQIG